MFPKRTSACNKMEQRLLFGLFACFAAWMLGCGQQPQDPGRAQQENSQMTENREFAVEGMVCEGCVSTITTALKGIPGVKSVEVSLKDKKATVLAAGVPSQTIEDTINKAGYKAHLITAAHSPISGK